MRQLAVLLLPCVLGALARDTQDGDMLYDERQLKERVHEIPMNSDIEGNDLSEHDGNSFIFSEEAMERIDETPDGTDIKIDDLPDDYDALTRQSRIPGSICGCGSMERCVTVFNCLDPGCNFTYECLKETDPDPCATRACQRNQACYRIRAENKGENSTCPDIIGKCVKVAETTEKPGMCPKVDSETKFCWWIWWGRSNEYDRPRRWHWNRRSCENDGQCSGDKKCCKLESMTRNKCMSPVTDGGQPGTCPTSTHCRCKSKCARDSDCPFGLKCCDCGGEKKCVKPVAPGTSGL